MDLQRKDERKKFEISLCPNLTLSPRSRGQGRQDQWFRPPLTLTLDSCPSSSFLMGDAIGKEGSDLISEGIISPISLCSVIRSPDPFICHRCGFRFPINGSVDLFKAFDSHWRVVLLCQECFSGVWSAQVCSYCFFGFSEFEKRFLDCNMCDRRVHQACVPLHHRNFSNSQLDAAKFICVDCCPIPQFWGKDSKNSGDSTSRTAVRVSLEDLVRGANSISEKKVTSKSKAMENATNKVMEARGSFELKRKPFDAVHLVKEPSYINFTVPDDKMPFRLHQAVNVSLRIFRTLSRKGLVPFTVRRKEQCSYNSVNSAVDSNFRVHHGKIEIGTENKSLIEDGGNSKSIMTNSSFFRHEIGDLLKQIRGCYTCCLGDLSSNEMEIYLKFSYSTDDGSNGGSALLLCHSLNAWLYSTTPLTKYRFIDCDVEGSFKLKRKSIDVTGPDWSMMKYFRKCWGGYGRIMQGNSHAILTNRPLLLTENADLMKKNSLCSTVFPRDFFLQKESLLKFLDYANDGNNACSTSLPCRSLNTWLNSTMPLTKYRFGDCDEEGSLKLQQKSIDTLGRGRFMKKYFRKHFCFGRIMQMNCHSVLTNPLFKRRGNSDLMERTRGWNTCTPLDFSLKKKEIPLKLPYSTDNGSNAGSILFPCHSLNTWLNSTMQFTKYRFGDGDGEGSSKLRRKSIDSMSYMYTKKYFRKRWSSKRVIQGNSQSILTNSPLFKKENEDLITQLRGFNTGCPVDFSLKEMVSSLNFPDSTNYGSNTGSALLPCHSLNTWPNRTTPSTKFRFGDGDGGRPFKMLRKSVDAMGSDNLKKYYRKRWGSRRIMQGNSQSDMANSPLFKQENADLMKQTMGCNTCCPGAFSLKENDISLKLPDSTDDDNNNVSGFLQLHRLNSCLNSTVPLTNYRFGDGDADENSKLQRMSIDAIGSDRSIKKYFRKHCSGRIMQGNNNT